MGGGVRWSTSQWLTTAVIVVVVVSSVDVRDRGRSGENNGCTAVRFAYGGKVGFDHDDVPSSMIPGQFIA